MPRSPLSRQEVAALTEAIVERGIDVDRLAESAGISASLMRMILLGELRPSPEIRKSLARALGIDPRVVDD